MKYKLKQIIRKRGVLKLRKLDIAKSAEELLKNELKEAIINHNFIKDKIENFKKLNCKQIRENNKETFNELRKLQIEADEQEEIIKILRQEQEHSKELEIFYLDAYAEQKEIYLNVKSRWSENLKELEVIKNNFLEKLAEAGTLNNTMNEEYETFKQIKKKLKIQDEVTLEQANISNLITRELLLDAYKGVEK